MTGIVLISLVPMRTNNSEQSEMCSQLLYGERIEVLEMQERWLRVRNLSDNYTGWTDRKMIHLLSEREENAFKQIRFKHLQTPLCACRMNGDAILLPGGSRIPFVGGTPYQFEGHQLAIGDADVSEKPAATERVTLLARQYLNVPYLWGGKSVLGMDCSGFAQVVFSMCGVQLPRDASMQVEQGETIDFLSEARAGDLAFFENDEGRIIHVGILLSSSCIIHASGWVKTDKIDAQGIISSQTGEYSHKLRIIKRLL